MATNDNEWQLLWYLQRKMYIHIVILVGAVFLILVQRLINLGRDLVSSGLELLDESNTVLAIVHLVHHHHLQQQQH